MNLSALETQLDDFDFVQRNQALRALAAAPELLPAIGNNVNMHLHSFFSYNARGFSPVHLAWESRRQGLYATALCDFDVLDGLDEFLDAGLCLGLRTAVHLETRAFLPEFAQAEINSPGEPGVTYIMGAGFARSLPTDSPEAKTLLSYRNHAARRNRELVARINPHVADLAIDYDRDVVPLSPGRCPTERHIIRAYVNQATTRYPDRTARISVWARLLGRDATEIEKLINRLPALEERVRAKFAKKGGFGYLQPTPDTFPPASEFIRWVRACSAIPMITWLDGTCAGEAMPDAMLDCLTAQGAAAVNIIPDRNWNITDPAQKAVKTAHLARYVEACDARALPVNIGTEMNRDGLPFVDDLSGPELKPYREIFTRGAQIMVGHSILLRYAGYSYMGPQADAEFGANRKARNRFFAMIGALPPLTENDAARLREVGPDRAFTKIQDALRRAQWTP
jgi:hypothetical protein